MGIDHLITHLAEALEIAPGTITQETTSEMIEEWDSLGQISILSRLDLVYNEITEKAPELASAVSVVEIYTILKNHGVLD